MGLIYRKCRLHIAKITVFFGKIVCEMEKCVSLWRKCFETPLPMSSHSFWHRAFHLYYDGFRQMTLGRTLWLIIAIKVFVIFVVLKLLFFPDFIGQNAEKGKEADFVAKELSKRVSDISE